MSAWGTGIRQSDEFMDVYDEFFDRYKDDATAMEVYRAILTEYQEEFSDGDEDPLLYTVYYALAQSLWECGERDEWLWQTVRQIIDTKADLKFWNELGNEPELIVSRRRALNKFWEKINSTPAKVRKPKKTGKKREPTLHKGDLYAYAVEGDYRAALVLDFVWNSFLTAITEEVFDHVPTEAEVMASHSRVVTWFTARESIPKKDRIPVSSLPINRNYNNRAGLLFSDSMVGCSAIGERIFFFDPEAAASCMERNGIRRYAMKELLDPAVLPKYHPRVNADLL